MENFRNLFRIGILSFLIGGCCSVTDSMLNQPDGQRNSTEEMKNKVSVEKLRQSTVAIMDSTLGINLPTCSGIWVGENLILTAAHCVEDKQLIEYSIADEYNENKKRIALTLTVEQDIDLALLLTSAGDVEHPVVTLTTVVISTGDPVHIIGHPVGYAWSYTQGSVAAIRPDIKSPMGKLDKVVQISAPVWMGNSGGGAFDYQGNLVGICSWISKSGPNLTFFIHRDVVEKFMLRHTQKL